MAKLKTETVKNKVKFSALGITKRSILKTLFVVFSCATLFFAILFGLIAGHTLKSELKSIYERHCIEMSYAYSLDMDSLTSTIYNILEAYSNTQIAREGSAEEIVNHFFTEKLVLPVSVSSLAYADINGNAILSTGKRVDISNRYYFKQIVENKADKAIGKPVVSLSTGVEVVHFAKAVYDENNNCKGLFFCSMFADYFTDFIQDLARKEYGSAFLLDIDGDVIIPPTETSIFNMYENELTDSAIADRKKFISLFSENSGVMEMHREKNNFEIVAFRRIPNSTWFFCVTIPIEKVFFISNHLKKQLFIMITLLFVLINIALIIITLSLFYRNKKRMKLESEQQLDPLTGLWTQKFFQKKTEELIEENPDTNFMFIGLDIRGFKVINQLYGAEAAAQILIFIGKELNEFALSGGGFAAHGYADRFFCVVKITDEKTALESFLNTVYRGFKDHSKTLHQFFPKAGIVFTGKDYENDSIEVLVGKASYARHSIKNSLIDSYIIFDEKMKSQLLIDEEIESLIPDAFENDEFFVVYQPKTNLTSEKIVGAEALVRWNSAVKGLMRPDEFIPLFERNGYIERLDFMVYKKTFDFIQAQIDSKKPIVPISVNMSRFHKDPEKFYKNFMELFSHYTIPTEYVQVEIVERSSGSDSDVLRDVTQRLHEAGFEVSMDDFGSGESSLNMLNTIPVDVLKLDQHFLYTAHLSEDTISIITKIVELASSLGKVVVCEGVETKEQVLFLKSIKCDQVQGYYFSKPLTESDFLKYLKEHK